MIQRLIQHVSAHPVRRRYSIAIAAFTAVGILQFGYHYLNFVTNRESVPLYEPLIEELTSAWGAGLLLMVVMLPLIRRLQRRDQAVALAGHAGLLIGYSVLHTTWNAVIRQAVYTLFGLGQYDYGVMPTRYAMEFPMDVIVYVLFVSLVTLFDHYRASRDHEVQVVTLEAELNRLRLATLESQLQPHFLFNALNTISSVMYEDLAAADNMLASLADLLRRTLRPASPPEVPLHEELKTLDLYFTIMKARFSDRLTIVVDVADEVYSAAVPPLLLQPLVENAFLHGDPGPGVQAQITLRARRSNGQLILDVEDNGSGISGVPEHAIGKGIGLGNTSRRLAHLYGDDHSFVLSNRPTGGLGVSIRVPFRDIATQEGS